METSNIQHPGGIILEQFRHLINSTYHLGRESAFKQVITEITTGTCMTCNSALLDEIENYLIESRSKVERHLVGGIETATEREYQPCGLTDSDYGEV